MNSPGRAGKGERNRDANNPSISVNYPDCFIYSHDVRTVWEDLLFALAAKVSHQRDKHLNEINISASGFQGFSSSLCCLNLELLEVRTTCHDMPHALTLIREISSKKKRAEYES